MGENANTQSKRMRRCAGCACVRVCVCVFVPVHAKLSLCSRSTVSEQPMLGEVKKEKRFHACVRARARVGACVLACARI